MARVTVVAVRAGTFTDGILRGKPNDVKKLDTVPVSFASAGSPDYRIPTNSEAVIIITDTAIDFVIVRSGNAATVEVAQPIPLAAGGISDYVMFLEDGDSDFFIRQMA